MIFHTNLFVQSFLINSEIKNFKINLDVGPQEVYGINKIKKICNEKLKINQYYKSKYGFDPPYLGGCQRWESDLDATEETFLFVDVDTIVCGSLLCVEKQCQKEQKILGVPNIGSPFRFLEEESIKIWDKIGKIFNTKFNYIKHQGVEISIPHGFNKKHFYIPDSYFNYGFILVPKKYKDEIKLELPKIIKEIIKNFGSNFWNGEIALCVAINKLNIPFSHLDIKYNYPDREEFFEKKPENDIRILHMVRKTLKKENDIIKIIKNNNKNKVEIFITKNINFYKLNKNLI